MPQKVCAFWGFFISGTKDDKKIIQNSYFFYSWSGILHGL